MYPFPQGKIAAGYHREARNAYGAAEAASSSLILTGRYKFGWPRCNHCLPV